MDHLIFRSYFLFLILFGNCYADQETVRGFLYCDEVGQWFVTNQPNLKSCCMEEADKVFLEGMFDEKIIGQAITLQGDLSTQEGQRFLMDAKVIQTNQKKWPLLLLLIGVGFLFSHFTRRFLHKARQAPQ